MTKENLIIVPGFGTNSYLFEELARYLSNYFTVFFIDLPGFTKTVPPLPRITMENYAQFVVDKINTLRLKHYLIAGMSLGFGIVSRIQFDDKCKGVLGIGPYLGEDSINPKIKAQIGIKAFFLDLICFFRLYRLAWQTHLFKNFLKKICLNRKLPKFILTEVDPRTYFETARLILHYHQKPLFDHLPHVLMMNKEDDAVSYDYLAKQMKDNIEKLLIVNTDMDHNLPELTQKYFAAKLPKEKIGRILKFIQESQPLSLWARAVGFLRQRLFGWLFVKKPIKS